MTGVPGNDVSGLALRISRAVRRRMPITRRSPQTAIARIPEAGAGEGNRLLIVVPWLTVGGADRVCLDLCTALRGRGWQVDLLLTEPHRNEWLKQGRQAADAVYEAHRLVNPRHFEELVVGLLQRRRHTHVLISNSERGYRALPTMLNACPTVVYVDLLHGQGGKNDRGGSPQYSRQVAHLLDHRVTVTDYLRKRLIDEGASPEQLSTIHNGVDPGGSRRPTPAGAPVVGFVGRLSQEKRPWIMRDIATALPAVEVRVAGDGPLRKVLSRDAPRNLVLRRHVSDVPQFLSALSLLVLPSEMEGLPLSILEAMAMGVPVVAADVGGIPEIITSNTGVLVPEGSDSQAYVSAIQPLLADRAHRSALGAAAEARISELFSRSAFADRYDTLLRRLSTTERSRST